MYFVQISRDTNGHKVKKLPPAPVLQPSGFPTQSQLLCFFPESISFLRYFLHTDSYLKNIYYLYNG